MLWENSLGSLFQNRLYQFFNGPVLRGCLPSETVVRFVFDIECCHLLEPPNGLLNSSLVRAERPHYRGCRSPNLYLAFV
jgi:hypothetical protein